MNRRFFIGGVSVITFVPALMFVLVFSSFDAIGGEDEMLSNLCGFDKGYQTCAHVKKINVLVANSKGPVYLDAGEILSITRSWFIKEEDRFSRVDVNVLNSKGYYLYPLENVGSEVTINVIAFERGEDVTLTIVAFGMEMYQILSSNCKKSDGVNSCLSESLDNNLNIIFGAFR